MVIRMKPFIKCIDYWPGEIPPEKLNVYRQLNAEEWIRIHRMIMNRESGGTVIEYYSIAPHEWTLEEMAKRAARRGSS